LSQISILELKNLDQSNIDSNAWLSGFSDADSNFSINIHKRTNKNSIRVQLYYRLEIKQTYHKINEKITNTSFHPIMSKISNYLETNLLNRTRTKENKIYYSFITIAHNKNSIKKLILYFEKFPLISSKYLDYLSFVEIFNLQEKNKFIISYLDQAITIRQNFNKTRTQFN
jgi:hypothetical protein